MDGLEQAGSVCIMERKLNLFGHIMQNGRAKTDEERNVRNGRRNVTPKKA